MRFFLLHPRDQLVAIMNRIYQNGMTTLSGGNLSVKDKNCDIWITPAGVDKGNLIPNDIMQAQADGAVKGPHKLSSEYPFHRAIYACRPDLNAIVHAHPSALVSFSIARNIPQTNIIPQTQRVCGPVGYARYALPGSEQLGANIADAFAKGPNVVLLENHGIVAGGPDLITAYQRLETLDFCARTLLKAQRLGRINTLTKAQLASFDEQDKLLPEFTPVRHDNRERELRRQIVEIVQRACARHLMISTKGVVSARVADRSFLITPTGLDRGSLNIEDIVLIQDSQRERGKRPSRSTQLHAAIYATHSDIHSVITAQPPNVTAYAIVERKFDTRIIPESYILLRDVAKAPYETQFQNPQQIADAVSEEAPALLIQNDAILTVGRTILQAFDRLEVAEFTARSLIETASLGEQTSLGDAEIDDLKRAFLD
ncbi:MAG: class II aldolase/adducin family protein [Planctomycetota bacterium]